MCLSVLFFVASLAVCCWLLVVVCCGVCVLLVDWSVGWFVDCLFVVSCSLFVVRCLLFVACCLLFVV